MKKHRTTALRLWFCALLCLSSPCRLLCGVANVMWVCFQRENKGFRITNRRRHSTCQTQMYSVAFVVKKDSEKRMLGSKKKQLGV